MYFIDSHRGASPPPGRGEGAGTGSSGGVILSSKAHSKLPVSTPPAPAVSPPSNQRPPPAPGPSGTGEAAPQGNWVVPLAVVVIGTFMSLLDTSIVNVAIPTMQNQFGVSTHGIEWVSTAYTLCLGVVVPTSAWLGERVGLRRLYVISLLSFAVFSALCGMPGDLNSMIFYRV